jgi:hypothetical protein
MQSSIRILLNDTPFGLVRVYSGENSAVRYVRRRNADTPPMHSVLTSPNEDELTWEFGGVKLAIRVLSEGMEILLERRSRRRPGTAGPTVTQQV